MVLLTGEAFANKLLLSPLEVLYKDAIFASQPIHPLVSHDRATECSGGVWSLALFLYVPFLGTPHLQLNAARIFEDVREKTGMSDPSNQPQAAGSVNQQSWQQQQQQYSGYYNYGVTGQQYM